MLILATSTLMGSQEKKLQLYSFEGQKEREWVLDSVIRYIKARVMGSRLFWVLLMQIVRRGQLSVLSRCMDAALP